MPVLKANHYRQAGKDAVVLDLGDLGRQAAKLRALAEQKAEAILDAAKTEAARLTEGAAQRGDERGHAEGLERGLAEGREQGKTEAKQQHEEAIRALVSSWNTALESFEETREQYLREARTATLRLAVTLAEKVVHRTVATDDRVVLDQAEAALSRVLEPAAATLRCSPDERALLADALPELTQRLTNITGIELVEDPAVDLGGCVVRCGQGRIDATVSTQLDRLTELLLGEEPQDPAEVTPDPTPIAEPPEPPPSASPTDAA